MGLSSKQVISSDGLDWNQTLLQAQTLELPKPTFMRQNQQQNLQQSSEPPLKCPRCDSTNTKFCYYNNYNKSQPRHFCKSCKRHWTKGGTLRNVPVGGGRKNKRLKNSKSNSKSASGSGAATTTTTTTTTTRSTTSSIINRVNPNMVIHAQQQKLNHNFDGALGEQKSVSEIMRQAIISPPSSSVLQQSSINNSNNNGVFLGSLPQNQGLQFPYSISSSCSFDPNPSSISSSFQFSNIYDYRGDRDMEDSTITTIMPTTISSSITHNQLWQAPNTSYWNWDDIDNFASTDLNMPWDDSELKP